ncbi:hypothetical protein IEQ34_020536 [Dendrobium chrysotoxum]|uniref:Annexin n=1 Tax=Dendrobium chrysotoxum TaxID=161865 RepID=A0AAV7G199_DENCH|nr:hypothetical protein IEQ34_020536 [Dendrobium chrysotoxum]
MAPSSSVTVDRYDERVCREIFMNQNQPNHLVLVLARQSSDERRQTKEVYRAMYGEELVEHLLRIKEANPESEPVYFGLWLWMMEPPERDAVVAKDAIERGSANDYKTIVEIYVRRKSSHLFASKQAYFAKCRSHMDKDILSVEPEHPGPKILAALSTSHRSHHDEVISQHIANCDAKRLNEALKKSDGGMDESSIIEIFSKRSIPQLRLAFSCYRHIYGNDYIEALENKSGDFEDSLRVVIQCMCAPYKYYSEMIYMSLVAEVDKKVVLTRVMIGSVEVGMNKVKETFQMRYKVKLEDAIVERVHDDDNYRDFLLALSNASG